MLQARAIAENIGYPGYVNDANVTKLEADYADVSN